MESWNLHGTGRCCIVAAMDSRAPLLPKRVDQRAQVGLQPSVPRVRFALPPLLILLLQDLLNAVRGVKKGAEEESKLLVPIEPRVSLPGIHMREEERRFTEFPYGGVGGDSHKRMVARTAL
jgi:hypothetical protein